MPSLPLGNQSKDENLTKLLLLFLVKTVMYFAFFCVRAPYRFVCHFVCNFQKRKEKNTTKFVSRRVVPPFLIFFDVAQLIGRDRVVLGGELWLHLHVVLPPPLLRAQKLVQADHANPEVEGDGHLHQGHEEHEDGDDLDADQPEGEAHAHQVDQGEGERDHDPGQEEPAAALGGAPDEEDGADGVEDEEDDGDDEEDEHGGGEALHVLVVLGGQVGVAALVPDVRGHAPQRHGAAAGGGVLPEGEKVIRYTTLSSNYDRNTINGGMQQQQQHQQ